jgi:hypothetical protein
MISSVVIAVAYGEYFISRILIARDKAKKTSIQI